MNDRNDSSRITSVEDVILSTTSQLTQTDDSQRQMLPCGTGYFPSVDKLKEIVELIRRVIFPDFFERRHIGNTTMRSYLIGVNVEKIFRLLQEEITYALRFKDICCRDEADEQATRLTANFVTGLPEIKSYLHSDVEAIFNNDPAVEDMGEVVLSYPALHALLNYRVAHRLLLLGIPVIPRMLTEIAHSDTGIDINPGAQIGRYFAIDHGTGVVIGETCIIGEHCTLYQGVTLGARNFIVDNEGRPINTPRHPILENNVTVYSNASILGRITVGHDSIVGGNVWLTHSVPPGSRILQQRAVASTFVDGAGI